LLGTGGAKTHDRTLRNLHDRDRIKEKPDQGMRQAVAAGAGFIGLEPNFVRRGIATTTVELQDQVQGPRRVTQNEGRKSTRPGQASCLTGPDQRTKLLQRLLQHSVATNLSRRNSLLFQDF
jgi:hypothetical protein